MKKICPKDSFKALCLTCSLCLSTACSVTAAEPNIETKLFQKIEAAGGINNLESVKDDIKRVLKLNPKHPGATFYAGQYCFQKGDFANAEKFLNRITTDPNYGSKANSILADIRLKKYNKRFMGTLRVYLTGESFAQALQLCEEALMDMPDNKELLFSASYAACMLGKKDRAESYAELYTTRTDNHELAAELKTLVDAWFTDDFDNQLAIEKFLSLKNKHLLTPTVKRKIKKLLISSKSIDRYEDFIRNEAAQPGADKDSLERELITFLLEQNQFDKALALINKRPVESLEDNLLYIWALCATDQQLKALNTAKHLMNVAPRDLRVYKAWVEAWISYTDKNKKMPEGKDDSGKTYAETIEHIFELLRPDKLVTQEPTLLLDLLRVANFSSNEGQCQKLQLESAKIAFENEHEKLLLKTADELIAFEHSRMALNILESAVNQLPNNYNIALKLATVYMETNPTAAIQICEEVMQQNPDLVRAFTTWCDAMNMAHRGGEAVSELVKRLEDKSLNEIVRRQLNSKLEQLRMEGNSDTPYTATPKREEGQGYGDEPDNDETNNDDIPGDELLDEITKSDNDAVEALEDESDINSYSPPQEEEEYDENLDF